MSFVTIGLDSLYLALNNMLVDLPRSNIILAGKRYVQITLIVPQIKIHLSPVVEHKDFAMPVGTLLTPHTSPM